MGQGRFFLQEIAKSVVASVRAPSKKAGAGLCFTAEAKELRMGAPMHGDLEYPLPPRERAFLDAAKEGDLHKLQELHAKGVPVDVLDNRDLPWGQTALMHAAQAGHADAVRFLLSVGAKVSAKDRGGGEVEQNRQPLHYAMLSKNIAVAEALLAAHANPNAVSHFGYTPLNVAIWEDNLEAVRLLLKRGANVNLKPLRKRYTPPLCAAAAAGKPQILRLLIEAGAEVNAVDSRNSTPLICASFASEELALAVIEALLKAGAKVDHIGDGRTALFTAIIHGHCAAARTLLKAGADANLIYESQQGTVLDVVEQRMRANRIQAWDEAARQTGAGQMRLQKWQEMFDLLREFDARRVSELGQTS
jgi:ankyrin repeat protein